MSQANGHTQTLSQLREQIETMYARRELAALQLEESSILHMERAVSDLRESGYYGYTGNAWGDFVDPHDAFRDSDLRVQPFGVGNRHDRKDGYNRPFVWHEIDLDLMRAQARWISTRNLIGVGLTNRIADYTSRTGFGYEARPGKRYRHDRVAQELARLVEEVLEEFQSFNLIETAQEQYTWAHRERDCVLKSVIDGDVFLRSFDCGEDGLTRVRFVEPEQVRQPLGSPPAYSFGILHAEGDVETPVEYAVSYEDADDWEGVPASDVSHLKRNVPTCVKRGLSDLYPGSEMFDSTSKMLRNMVVTGGVQAAIAWIEQFDAATPGAISTHAGLARDQNRPQFARPFTGKEINYQKIEPGSIPKISAGREYIAQPTAVNAGSHTTTVQAGMRALCMRWGMPEYMTGDASNANYSSTLVSGSPFVVATECEQALSFAPFFVRVMWQGPIRNAARAGRFLVNGRRYSLEEVSRYVDVIATPPQVAISDPQREAAMDHQDIAAGVMSKQTRRARLGLDDETERQNLKEEPVEPQGQGKGEGKEQEGNPLAALLGEAATAHESGNLLEVAEWAAAIMEAAKRQDGEEWETNGRRYKREGGKTIRVATKKAEPAKKDKKPAKKDEKKPEPKPQPKSEPSAAAVEQKAESAFARAWDKAEQRFRLTSVLPKIPMIYDDLKEEMPELSEEDFHALLKKWQSENRLTLQVVNDPKFEPLSSRAIEDPRGKLLYVEVKPGAFDQAAKRPPEPARKPEPAKPAEKPAHALAEDHPVSKALSALGVKLTPELLADPEALAGAIRAAVTPAKKPAPKPKAAPKEPDGRVAQAAESIKALASKANDTSVSPEDLEREIRALNLSSMNRADLAALGKSLNANITSKSTRGQIIDAIERIPLEVKQMSVQGAG